MRDSLPFQLAQMPDAERREVLALLSPAELEALAHDWPSWARTEQLPPPAPWRTWLMLGGRGSGKSRASAEAVRARVEAGRARSIGLISPTADSCRRDVVEGPSGILAVATPWCKPEYTPATRKITWPSGAVAYLLSSEEPDRIRGVNLDFAWGDELTSWQNARQVWDNLQFALRLPGPAGDAAAAVVSTTPKPQALLREILSSLATVVSKMRTLDNRANLDPATVEYLLNKYGGTSIGRQELDAEILEDMEGALWSRAMLDACRVPADQVPEEYERVIIGVDPAGSSRKGSAETGIIAAGLADGEAYIFSDLSGRFGPEAWARRVVDAYHDHLADRVVCEVNFGGEMVAATIRAVDRVVPVRMVTASRGKMLRAEPVVALYEQRRVHHVGVLPALEDQQCQWVPGEGPSPDRVDAAVWAITELMLRRSLHDRPRRRQPINLHIYQR